MLIASRFLWVAFQLDAICNERTDEKILNALADLPKDLPETFNRILQRLRTTEGLDMSICRNTFQLVAASQRPLTLEELREALSVIPGDTVWNPKRLVNNMKETLRCCGSLLTIDEEQMTVHFVHHSVKQHLLTLSVDPRFSEYHVDLSRAEIRFGEVCVTYLSFDIFDTRVAKVKSPQNFDYPSAIVVISTSQSKTANKLALKYLNFLKGDSNAGYDMGAQLEQGRAKFMEPTPQRHPFLIYAQEFWLFHTKLF